MRTFNLDGEKISQVKLRNKFLKKRLISIYLPIIAITVLGGILRFHQLGTEAIWHDESATWRFAQLPLSQLWGKEAVLETNPPLYYTLQKFWLIFGQSEFALRSLAAVIGTLTIPLVYGLGRTLAGQGLGLLAAALFATSSFNIRYSQEARTYSLMTAAITLAMWGLAFLMKNPGSAKATIRRAILSCLPGNSLTTHANRSYPRIVFAWLAYIIGICVALYSHNTAVLFPVVINIVVLIWWAQVLNFDRNFLGNWLSVHSIILVIYLWWLRILIYQAIFAIKDFWIPSPTWEIIKKNLTTLYGYQSLWWEKSEMGTAIWWIAIAFVWGLALLGLWYWRKQPTNLALTVTFFIGVPLLGLLISMWRPIFIPRIFLWTTVPWFVLIAGGCLAFRSKILRAFLITILLMIQLKDTGNYYQDYHKEPWDKVAEYVVSSVHHQDLILFFPTSSARSFQYYFQRSNIDLSMYGISKGNHRKYSALNKVEAIPIRGLLGTIESFDRVWLVTRKLKKKDSKGLVISELRTHLIEQDYQSFMNNKKLEVFLFKKAKL